MNSREKVSRNDEIVRERMQGLGWDVISQTHSVDKRSAERIFAEFRETQPTLRELDPIEVVEDLLLQLQGMADQLALLSVTAKQDSVKLGALKARRDALFQVFDLLRATGVMPRNLAGIKVEMDVSKFGETVLRVFDEHGVPEDVQAAIMDAIRPPERAQPSSN